MQHQPEALIVFERIADALERIAAAAEQMTPLPEQEAPESEGCQHPEESRIALPAMGSPDKFFCKVCQAYVNG